MKANKLAVIAFFGFAALVVNLVRMQIIKGDYYLSLSEKNRLRAIYLEGPRGNITDRNGEALATNRLSFNCSAIPREARSDIDDSCGILSGILNRDAAELKKTFLKGKPGVFNTVLVAEDISSDQAIAIEEKLDSLPGFMIETRPRREYPYGEAVGHIMGFIGPITQEESGVLEAHGYRDADWIGRDGIEKSYESYLRGQSGGIQIEVDSRGRFVQVLGLKEAEEGRDLELTIDAKLQAYIYGLLESQRGAVIVMDLKEGGILAMVSAPSFDPNLFASTQGRKEVGKYLRSSAAPMVNRGIRSRYPPGSIFKIVVSAAALDKRKITPLREFDCPGFITIGGHRFNCAKEGGHGLQNLSSALEHSCNVYFYNAGLVVGPDALFEKAVEFGFSHATGVDLPNEKEGFVPSRDWKKKVRGGIWYDGETANLSIGQGYLEVTPIQALLMIAAVATNGEIYKPHLISKIDGQIAAEKHTRHMIASAESWRNIQNGLDRAVNSETGTGRLARVEDLRVLGKTGTAQSGQKKTHAWFVGYAPKAQPEVAVAVFLEQGGVGGVAAAGIAHHVFQWLRDAAYL